MNQAAYCQVLKPLKNGIKTPKLSKKNEPDT